MFIVYVTEPRDTDDATAEADVYGPFADRAAAEDFMNRTHNALWAAGQFDRFVSAHTIQPVA